MVARCPTLFGEIVSHPIKQLDFEERNFKATFVMGCTLIRQQQRDFQKVDLVIIKHLIRGEGNSYQIFEFDANNTQKDNEESIPRADLRFWLRGAHVRRKCTGSPIFMLGNV